MSSFVWELIDLLSHSVEGSASLAAKRASQLASDPERPLSETRRGSLVPTRTLKSADDTQNKVLRTGVFMALRAAERGWQPIYSARHSPGKTGTPAAAPPGVPTG